MNTNLNLSDKSLRSRIDGLNFVSITTHKELCEKSSLDTETLKQSILLNAIKAIAPVLPDIKNKHQIIKSKLIANLTNELGIYNEGMFKGPDFFLNIQFKGFFFAKDHAFHECRAIMHALLECYGLFRPSLIDIAQDFMLPIDQVLPNPNQESHEYRYGFRFKSANYFSQQSKNLKGTGFNLSSGRYMLKVYDKLEENRSAKNKRKKEYYDNLYADQEFVTRVELRLKQEFCQPLLEVFYDPTVEEDRLIKHALQLFYRKHKLRIRNGSKDNDHRRWLVHPAWMQIFNPLNSSNSTYLTAADYRFTSGKSDSTWHLNALVENFVDENPCIDKSGVIERIKQFNFDKSIERSRNNVLKRKRTKDEMARIRKSMNEKYRSGGWLDPTPPGDTL